MSTAKVIHVGTPTAGFPLEESIVVNFHDFANLPAGKDQCVTSPRFNCAGYEWVLIIYPGGHSNSRDGMIGIFLICSEDIDASFRVCLLRSDGAAYKAQKWKNNNTIGGGDVNFVSRGEIFEESNHILNNGALSFRVHVKPNKEYYCQTASPQPNIADNIFTKLFNDEDSADVAFNVMGVVYYAHKTILRVQAPELFDLTEQFDMETKMPINDIEPDIFEIMLKYVYGKSIPTREWKAHSKRILDASGKYGLSALKVEAEAWHVKKVNVSVNSAIDELLRADGTHCLLLKKAVMDFIVENGQAVIASPSFAKLAESTELMKEVMLELAKSNESRKRKRDD